MRSAIVTAGPTYEKIDPVRFISNFSSGKQGYAIAKSLRDVGYDVTLISGPVNIKAPNGVKLINVQSAEQMYEACLRTLPVDIAICAAAVCDFRVNNYQDKKIKKQNSLDNITLNLVQNPDILRSICQHDLRPKLVIGFAAETDNLLENAKIKLQNKGCDLIIANDVKDGKVFGSDNNSVYFVSKKEIESYIDITKDEVAHKICNIISILLEDVDI